MTQIKKDCQNLKRKTLTTEDTEGSKGDLKATAEGGCATRFSKTGAASFNATQTQRTANAKIPPCGGKSA